MYLAINTVKILYVFLLIFGGIHWVSAADTVIQNIPGGQVSNNSGPYGNSVSTLSDGDLKFINQNGDADIVGDFLLGYYYDPAYGVFQIAQNSSDRVRISSESFFGCQNDFIGYKLEGYSYNSFFGFMDFNYDSNTYSYICFPSDPSDETINAYMGGYAFSPYIGFQSLSGIEFDSSVDVDEDRTSEDDSSEGSFIKVEGTVASENNTEIVDNQFQDEIRILGKLTKSTFKRDIHQQVYPIIGGIETDMLPNPYTLPSVYVGNITWENVSEGEKILNNTGLYFRETEIRIGGQDNIEGQKTLIVEGENIYITGNIRDTDNNGMLGLIALQKNGVGGNIYIEPSVTDIHAVMYADRSIMSYDGTAEFDGSTPASELANQLYIQGSVFSENTIGASQKTPAECPFYVASSDCTNQSQAEKYDFNFLRRYILVQPVDADGNPTGDRVPQFGGLEAYIGDDSRDNTESQKPGYRKFPVIIEYDSKIQQTPPPFFN